MYTYCTVQCTYNQYCTVQCTHTVLYSLNIINTVLYSVHITHDAGPALFFSYNFFLFPIPSILQFLVSHFAVSYCTKMLSFLIDLVHFMSVPIINVIRKMFTNLFWPNIVYLSFFYCSFSVNTLHFYEFFLVKYLNI